MLVGAYEILAELGRGGMGVVYKARHVSLNRVVALKMMSGLGAPGPELQARFRREAEAVARLQHPNIVQLFEAGEHLGQPYFTLEFVAGGTLSQYLAGKPLLPRQAAALLEPIARAVQYAHDNGIVHRDLKPGNILIAKDEAGRVKDEKNASVDSAPSVMAHSSSIKPKITDFGLARIVEAPGLTQTEMVMGTPEYMAPEQATGQSSIGPAADIWSLGAILYTMLTGRPPFQAANALDTLMLVKSAEPVSVTRLQPSCPRDLGTICLHCLNKSPDRRYASAAALANDLLAFLEDRPISARPAGMIERTVKFVRRRPALAALCAAVIAAVASGLVGTSALWRAAQADAHAASVDAEAQNQARLTAEERQVAELNARHAVERITSGLYLDEAQAACERGETGRGLLTFARALELATSAGDLGQERVARAGIASWRHFYVRRVGVHTRTGHELFVQVVAFSPDGRAVASGGLDKAVRFLEAATGQPTGVVLSHGQSVQGLAYSPDGRFLLVTCASRDELSGEARLWDLRDSKGIVLEEDRAVFKADYSADGQTLLVVGLEESRLYDAGTHLLLARLPHGRDKAKEVTEIHARRAGEFSRDGRLVLTTGLDGMVRIWDARSGAPVGEPLRSERSFLTATFHPDGKRIAAGGFDGTFIWELSDRRNPVKIWLHRGPVFAIAYSRDGHVLAAGGDLFGADLSKRKIGERPPMREIGGEVRLWRDDLPLAAPLQHGRAVRALALSGDGSLLLTGSDDGRARFFWTFNGQMAGQPFLHEGVVRSVAVSPDGRRAATAAGMGGSRTWTTQLWEPPLPPFARQLAESVRVEALAFDSTGTCLAAAAGPAGVRFWNPAIGSPSNTLQAPAVHALALAPRGELLATASSTGDLVLWDRQKAVKVRGERLNSPVAAIAFRQDGATFVTASDDGSVREWDGHTGRELRNLVSASGSYTRAALTPDGTFALLCPEEGRRVQRWDLANRTASLPWEHLCDVVACQIGVDGQEALVLAANESSPVRNAVSGQPISPPMQVSVRSDAVALANDGKTTALAGDDKTVRICDVATGKVLGAPIPHPTDQVMAVSFAPDSKTLGIAYTYSLWLWPVPQPIDGTPDQVKHWVQNLTGSELDERGGVLELVDTSKW